MSKPDGGKAFARPYSKSGDYTDSESNFAQEGMSLRDYFAAKALHGFIAASDMRATFDPDQFAKNAYIFADAMIAERAKK